MWCAVDIHNRMRHICAKGFLDSNFNYSVIDKISIFHEIAPNFHILTKMVMLKVYNWTFLDQLLLP